MRRQILARVQTYFEYIPKQRELGLLACWLIGDELFTSRLPLLVVSLAGMILFWPVGRCCAPFFPLGLPNVDDS
jgi:hypothetical protein